MSTQSLIPPTLAAVVAIDTKNTFNAATYDRVVFHADGLAAAETAQVLIGGGAVYVPACDLAGNLAVMTATEPMVVLPGGPHYAVTKQATVGACGVYGTGCGDGAT